MRYWPVKSVEVSRFNPMLWFRIVTWAPEMAAPLASVTVPKTVASCVWGHAQAGSKANDRVKSKHALHLKNAQMCASVQGVEPAAKEVGAVGVFMAHFPGFASR